MSNPELPLEIPEHNKKCHDRYSPDCNLYDRCSDCPNWKCTSSCPACAVKKVNRAWAKHILEKYWEPDEEHDDPKFEALKKMAEEK